MRHLRGRNLLALVFATAPLLALGQPAAAQQRTAVLATGSSTVAPFTSAVAARLAEDGPRATVRSVGTIGGFAEFCQGMGPRFPDIQNASRRMNAAELTHCGSRGVHEIMELPIGYDGIVVAYRVGLEAVNFRVAELWRGLAREVPDGGRMVPNPHRTWRDVAPHLPDWPIRLIGPPTTSGTRESFTELALVAGCQAVPEIRSITDAARRRRACVTVREDGGWLDGGEDDEAIIRQIVDGERGTLGIFGFSFLEGNRSRIEAARINGVNDTRETIASGRYPLSRPLFLYVKRANLELMPGLADFVAEYMSDRAIGPEGYLVRQGLVPLDPAGLANLRQIIRNRTVLVRLPG